MKLRKNKFWKRLFGVIIVLELLFISFLAVKMTFLRLITPEEKLMINNNLIFGERYANDFFVRGVEDYDSYINSNLEDNKTLILVVGDSFTYGWGLDYEQSYSYQLGQELSKLFPDEYLVINLGIANYNTEYEFKRLNYFLKYKPKIIVWQYFRNDMSPILTLNYLYYGSKKDTVLNESLYKTYRYMVEHPLKFEKPLFYLKNKKYFFQLERISKDQNITLIIFDFNSTSIKKQLQNLDFHYFNNVLDYEDYILLDDLHPNAEYNKLLAKNLFNYLQENNIINNMRNID